MEKRVPRPTFPLLDIFDRWQEQYQKAEVQVSVGRRPAKRAGLGAAVSWQTGSLFNVDGDGGSV